MTDSVIDELPVTEAAPAVTVKDAIASLEARIAELAPERDAALLLMNREPTSPAAHEGYSRIKKELQDLEEGIAGLRASNDVAGRQRWKDSDRADRKRAVDNSAEVSRLVGTERIELAKRIDARLASLLGDFAEWRALGSRCEVLLKTGVHGIMPSRREHGPRARYDEARHAAIGRVEWFDQIEGVIRGREFQEGGGALGLAQSLGHACSGWIYQLMADLDRLERDRQALIAAQENADVGD